MKALCLVCLLPLLFLGCRKDKPFTCHITGRAVMANDHSQIVRHALIIQGGAGAGTLGGPSVGVSATTDTSGRFTLDIPDCTPGQLITLYAQKLGFFDPLDNYIQLHANRSGNTIDVPMKKVCNYVIHVQNVPPVSPTDSMGFTPTGFPFDGQEGRHGKRNLAIGAIDTFVCCGQGAQGYPEHISWSTWGGGKPYIIHNDTIVLKTIPVDTLHFRY